MASVQMITETKIVLTAVELTLSGDEAGVLLALLDNHVAGPVVHEEGELGQIRLALRKARVKPVTLVNHNRTTGALPYALLERADRLDGSPFVSGDACNRAESF